MVVQAEDTGPRFTERGDPRITRVGRFIRRTRIDELPQLVNVFRGEMSLVGPRPERPEIANRLSERYPYFQLRCYVKPGCTGWAQIRLGYVNEFEAFEKKVALDLYYMKYRSVTMDALILWKTFRTLFLLEGV
jgi:lipopolysaccharide/colanic/teichoic acid biosynthesis glycosyltransferase